MTKQIVDLESHDVAAAPRQAPGRRSDPVHSDGTAYAFEGRRHWGNLRRIMARNAQVLTGSRRPRSKIQSRQVAAGKVAEVIGRRVRVRLGSGSVVGPVDAELSMGESGGSLWAIFPGPEHDDVLPEEVHVRASRSVRITSGAARLTRTREGRATMRGCDFRARGSRSASLTGGTVRLARRP